MVSGAQNLLKIFFRNVLCKNVPLQGIAAMKIQSLFILKKIMFWKGPYIWSNFAKIILLNLGHVCKQILLKPFLPVKGTIIYEKKFQGITDLLSPNRIIFRREALICTTLW